MQDSSPTNRRLPKPVEYVREASNLYLKRSRKKLKPLYYSYLKREKEEKVFDSTLTNSNQKEKVHLQKLTSSSISKNVKSGSVLASQNYNNINKNHLNSLLNDSQEVKEVKTEGSAGSKQESIKGERDNIGVVIDDLNEKLIDTFSTKNNKESNFGNITIKEKSEVNTETSKKERKTENDENFTGNNLEKNTTSNLQKMEIIEEGDKEKDQNNSEVINNSNIDEGTGTVNKSSINNQTENKNDENLTYNSNMNNISNTKQTFDRKVTIENMTNKTQNTNANRTNTADNMDMDQDNNMNTNMEAEPELSQGEEKECTVPNQTTDKEMGNMQSEKEVTNENVAKTSNNEESNQPIKEENVNSDINVENNVDSNTNQNMAEEES